MKTIQLYIRKTEYEEYFIGFRCRTNSYNTRSYVFLQGTKTYPLIFSYWFTDHVNQYTDCPLVRYLMEKKHENY